MIEVWLCNQQYLIKRNLPGQRLGAKALYWYFGNYVTETLGFSGCAEQPCLAKWVDGGCNKYVWMIFCFAEAAFSGQKKVPCNVKEVQCQLKCDGKDSRFHFFSQATHGQTG